MAVKYQGGKAVPAGRVLRPGVDPMRELQKLQEAARLVEQLQNTIQQLRLMGKRDPNLDLAMTRARECEAALGNAME